MADEQRYSFTVTIGFVAVASNKHDALRAALDVESSLNEASCRAIYGGNGSAVRVKAPVMTAFKESKRRVPEQPVERTVPDAIKRRQQLLKPLTYDWRVRLRWQDGREYEYVVTAPTKPQAIEAARIKCYHDTSHLGHGLSLISVRLLGVDQ